MPIKLRFDDDAVVDALTDSPREMGILLAAIMHAFEGAPDEFFAWLQEATSEAADRLSDKLDASNDWQHSLMASLQDQAVAQFT